MTTRCVLASTALASAVVALGQIAADASTDAPRDSRVDASVHALQRGAAPATHALGGASGPDVIVGDLQQFSNWGQDGTHRAFSLGTTSCNIGDEELAWVPDTNQHPVISQNMYRLKDGRFEQLGQSWLKHGFFALAGSLCEPCQGDAGFALGVGCSDPYTSDRNGGQGGAGPKYQVNATTGFFNYPPANPPYSGPTARRLRVLQSDVDPAQNADARYFVEGQYVHPVDNALTGSAGNNASHREVAMGATGAIQNFLGDTKRMQPAIVAWQIADPSVRTAKVTVAGEGSVIRVMSQAYDNGDGTWRYEYALHNLNSDRSAGALTIPVPADVTLTDVGFHDVDYHSGEPWDGTDWTWTRVGDTIVWSTVSHASNPNANAVRWGTLYNFWFTANTPPVNPVTGQVGLFKPGTPGAINVLVKGPDVLPGCPPDLDGNGAIGFSDLNTLLGDWGPCAGCPSDLVTDGTVGFADLNELLDAWGPC